VGELTDHPGFEKHYQRIKVTDNTGANFQGCRQATLLVRFPRPMPEHLEDLPVLRDCAPDLLPVEEPF